MNTIIINEPLEQLEVRPGADTISLVKKTRRQVMDEWDIKIIVLNRREALAIHKAISDVYLSLPRRPRRSYIPGRMG